MSALPGAQDMFTMYLLKKKGTKETLLFMSHVCLVSLLLSEFYSLVGLVGKTLKKAFHL